MNAPRRLALKAPADVPGAVKASRSNTSPVRKRSCFAASTRMAENNAEHEELAQQSHQMATSHHVSSFPVKMLSVQLAKISQLHSSAEAGGSHK